MNPSRATDFVRLHCDIEARSERAIRITDHASGIVEWVPLSQVEEIHEQPDGHCIVLLAKWLATKKGFV